MNEFNFLELLANTALASLGGLVRRLSELEKSGKKKVTLSYYIVGALISMFVGIVIFLLCKNFNVSMYLTAGLTSLGGYLGVPVLDLLSNIAVKKVKEQTGFNNSEENVIKGGSNKKK